MMDFPWYPQIDGCRDCGATEAEACACSQANEPLFLHSDYGQWILADDEDQALVVLTEQYGDDHDGYRLRDAGWMHDVGWNAHEYDTKAEFERESGFNSWWEGCLPPAGEKPTKSCRRAFEVV